MKLYECQAKTIFKQFGIPIPKGRIASNARSAKRISEELGGKVVIKAQILTGGRGKAGGIQPVQTPEEAYVVTSKILSMKIHGLPVKKILVEEIVDFSREMYLGLFVDRTEKQHVILSSKTGGINIENRIMDDPKSLHYFPIDLLLGLQEYKIREIAISLDIPKELWMPFSTICSGLYNAYKKNDAILAEINPLVLTTDNHLKALDGKMTIDDNALFRQPQFVDCCDMGTQSEFEQQANKTGLSFFSLHGNIGCIAVNKRLHQ